jgi:hypothetical protein
MMAGIADANDAKVKIMPRLDCRLVDVPRAFHVFAIELRKVGNIFEQPWFSSPAHQRRTDACSSMTQSRAIISKKGETSHRRW